MWRIATQSKTKHLVCEEPRVRKPEKKRSERSEELHSANTHGLRPADQKQVGVV
jgi:hypothetical protein